MTADKCYTLDLAPLPMDENTFDRIIPGIIAEIEKVGVDYLVICYKPLRDDRLYTIQVCRHPENYHIELIFSPNEEKAYGYTNYSYDPETLEETISIFKQVTVFERFPSKLSWKNTTNVWHRLDEKSRNQITDF